MAQTQVHIVQLSTLMHRPAAGCVGHGKTVFFLALYLCQCLMAGTPGGFASPYFLLPKAEEYITRLENSDEKPRAKDWSSLWGPLLPLAVAPSCYYYPRLMWITATRRGVWDTVSAHLFYPWNNSMAFKCSTSKYA